MPSLGMTFDPADYLHANIPPQTIDAICELSGFRQWVAWRFEERDGRETKVPVNPATGRNALSSKSQTWGTYDAAVGRAIGDNLPGIGIVLTDHDEYTGIDLDKCIREDGTLEPWAAEMIALAETYTEISPSGRGLRLIARGKIPASKKSDAAGVELYVNGRYLTITGNHYAGTPEQINPAPRTIKALMARIEAMKPNQEPMRQPENLPKRQPSTAPSDGGSDFFRNVNSAALSRLEQWVTSIFPAARRGANGAWRVSSRSLGRDLQEDLSLSPEGIVDFGVHDMGDARDGKRTPIDIVMEWNGSDAAQSAHWLCDRIGVDPSSLGWNDNNDEELARIGAQSARNIVRAKTGEWIDGETGELIEPAHLPGAPPSARGRLIDLGSDVEWTPPDEIIRDTIPAEGVGFLGGQSGAFKTFAAIELSFCILTGEPFAGRKVEKPGGVLYVAAEGAATISGRVKARRSKLTDPDRHLPLVMLEGFGQILSAPDYRALKTTLDEAIALMRERWAADLRVVIIDTVAAAGMIPVDKENDQGAWQRIFDGLNPISKSIGAPIILIHHYGKAAEAGLRGSSNARAGADFVLAMTCERNEQTGETVGHALALAKSRTSQEGPIGMVRSEEVEIGRRTDGTPVTSLVLEFDTGTRLKTAKRPNRADETFLKAFHEALAAHGEHVPIDGASDAPIVQAVRLRHLKAEFEARYPTGTDDEKKRRDTIRKQFGAALGRRPPSIVARCWNDEEWFWVLTSNRSAGGHSE